MKSWFKFPIFLIFLVFILSTFLFLHPLLKGQAIAGHDAGYHYTRLQLFTTALKQGQFPVRWIEIPGLSLSHPLFEFYPVLFYYPGALLSFLGLPYLNGAYATLFLAAAFGWLGMFVLVKKLTASNLAGVLAATLFLFTPYRLSQLYVRASFGEFLAVSFLPFLFLGGWQIFKGENLKTLCYGIFWEAVGVAVVITSHQPTFLMIALPLAGFLLYQWMETQNNRRLVISLAGLAWGAALAAFFILPAIFEQQFIRLGNMTQGYFDFRQHFAYFSQLIYSAWGYGISQKGPNDGMSFQVGVLNWLIVVAAAAYSLASFWQAEGASRISKTLRDSGQARVTIFCLIVFLFGIFMSTDWSLPVWERFPLLGFIQYPWRFLAITTFASSVLAGILWAFWEKQKTAKKYLLYTFSGAVAVMIIFNIKFIAPASYFPANYFDLNNPALLQYTSQQSPFFGVETSFLPVWVQEVNSHPPGEKGQVVTGQADISQIANLVTLKEFKIIVKKTATIRFNTHYFPGWMAKIDNGKEISLVSPGNANAQGNMEITLTPGNYQVSLEFTKTAVRLWSDYLSLGAGLGLLILLVFPYYWESILRHSGKRTKRAHPESILDKPE